VDRKCEKAEELFDDFLADLFSNKMNLSKFGLSSKDLLPQERRKKTMADHLLSSGNCPRMSSHSSNDLFSNLNVRNCDFSAKQEL